MTRIFGEKDAHAFAASFVGLLPAGFVAAAQVVASVQAREVLWPEEWAQARPFRANRLQEFAAGRAAARAALAQLGIAPLALPIGAGRAPQWPPGIIGSISHAGGLALAAAGPDNRVTDLGIDIERQEALSAALAELIVAPQDSRPADPTLLFSIKESAFKCLYRSVGRVIDYTETTVSILEETGEFILQPSSAAISAFATVRGRFDSVSGFWRACCFLGQPPEMRTKKGWVQLQTFL